ncbi:MAG: Sulfur carrier protein FdhD, partial [Nocardioidaceae bacterium]|nr:Sulfur carrier protein FdhD [Nocardioidaceae bacterium]
MTQTQARRPGPMARVRIDELKGETRIGREDKVITEEPLEIRLAEPGVPARRI